MMGDRSKGFEYLGVFSDAGLAMCDPELIRFPGSKLAALCKSRIQFVTWLLYLWFIALDLLLRCQAASA